MPTRNRLAFPCGLVPGFDPSHSASRNCRFSVVNIGSGAVNLLNGKPGVVTNFAQTIDGIIGPAQISTTSGGSQCFYTFSGGPTAPETQITFACIIRAGAPLFNSTILANNEVGAFNAGAYFHSNNLNWEMDVPPSGLGSANFVLTQGVPYFLGGSIDNSGNYTTIAVRMDTGQVVFTSSGVAAHGIAATATTGHFYVGSFENAGSGFLGSIAAAMYSGCFLSLPQWQQWAADPWSFWYPDVDASYVGIITVAPPPSNIAPIAGRTIILGSRKSIAVVRKQLILLPNQVRTLIAR